MHPSSIRSILVGTTIVMTAAMATAQSTAPVTQTPAAVGTTPQTAAEANRKAVQRSDTSTLVRTGPSAADKARSAMGDSARPADTSGATSTTSTTNAASGLPPKPDRN